MEGGKKENESREKKGLRKKENEEGGMKKHEI